MRINSRYSILGLLLLAAALSVLATGRWTSVSTAAQPADPGLADGGNEEGFEGGRAERERDEDRERAEEERARRPQQRIRELRGELEEIEKQIHGALERGDRDRAEALKNEAHELVQRLREFESEFGEHPDERFEEREEHQRQMEREIAQRRMELELERAELEASFGRLEMVSRITQIAANELAAASYAVLHVEQAMELPEAVDFLNHMLKESTDPAVKRVIRIRLMELNSHLDRRDDVREQMQHLILGR